MRVAVPAKVSKTCVVLLSDTAVRNRESDEKHRSNTFWGPRLSFHFSLSLSVIFIFERGNWDWDESLGVGLLESAVRNCESEKTVQVEIVVRGVRSGVWNLGFGVWSLGFGV